MDQKKAIRDFKLRTLLEITNAINSNLPEQRLFELFEEILKDELKIGKGLIYLQKEDGWKTALSYGLSTSDLRSGMEEELLKINDITVVDTSRGDATSSFDVVIPVLHHEQALAYLLLGDLDEQAIRTSPIIKHLSFIQTLANITVVAVENQRLNRENLERERMKQELRMARQMQEMLLPTDLPEDAKLDAYALYKPHSEVGGDIYDVISPGDGSTVFCMADVSGKGMSAAILMANFQAHLRANLMVESKLEQVIRNLNKTVWQSAQGDRFITCFLARYNPKNQELSYINAAHPPAYLKGKYGTESLDSSCVGLGMFPEMPFLKLESRKVDHGDLFICYTDGISETENNNGTQFQDGPFEQAIEEIGDQSAEEVNALLIKKLDAFRENQPFTDDVALVSCRFV